MCKGSFGGSEGNDNYLCVQSMDGMLSIFEYESHSLTCFLPKCLIPGPFRYVPRTDSFVTVSSSWHLESYKYQSLALTSKFGSSSQSKNNKEEDDMLSSSSGGKRIMPDYSYNMGEAALDIQVHGPHVLVLGERNLFCFTETCTLRFMKKLDYNPSAFCVYGSQSANSDSVQFLIATHSKLLYVHQVRII
jgi:Bardet-Biedl syndrome 9 protein